MKVRTKIKGGILEPLSVCKNVTIDFHPRNGKPGHKVHALCPLSYGGQKVYVEAGGWFGPGKGKFMWDSAHGKITRPG